MNIISNNSQTIYHTIKKILNKYRAVFTKKSFQSFSWIIISIISFDQVQSIRFIWKHFISKYKKDSLNSLYYFLSYSSWNLNNLMIKTTEIALSLIPENLADEKIYLIIDDTLQEKFGDKFAGCQSFFDHVGRNNSSYLKGNSFVALAISIPVSAGEDEINYLSIPLGFRLYKKEKSKLTIARELILNIIKLIDDKQAVILCDSWYSKGDVIDTVEEFENIEFVGAVRKDTAFFDLPPEHNGKRGRPRKYGDKLSLKDLEYEKTGDYYIASKIVKTRLFDDPVEIVVTLKELEGFKSPRVYINTDTESESLKDCFLSAVRAENYSDQKNGSTMSEVPVLKEYRLRWNIEIIFYELKTFWSFGNYMVVKEKGIEAYINLLATAYTIVKCYPFMIENKEEFINLSPQQIKNNLSRYLREELILGSFVSDFENTKIYGNLKDCLHSFISFRDAA